MGKLADLLEEKFKCKTREEESPAGTAVGAAAAVCFLPHPDRLALVFINLSVNPIFLGLTDAVAAGNGIWVQANGGMVSMFYGEDFSLVGRRWWAIAPAGASAYFTLQLLGE